MPPPRPPLESQPLVYAVGDVHGRADLLEALVAFIADDAATVGCSPAVVLLGDLVDRGPESRTVLDVAVEAIARWPASRLCLGNHDQMFLNFLEGADDYDTELLPWLSQGGDETLESYRTSSQALAGARRQIVADHPAHLALLRHASLIESDSTFAFVHAGINPQRTVDRQSADDLLWIRAPFLRHLGPLDRIIVHGHSPQKPPRPHVTENRISLDTGAFFTGILSALRIDRATGTLSFVATDWRGNVESIEPVLEDRGFGTVLDRFGK